MQVPISYLKNIETLNDDIKSEVLEYITQNFSEEVFLNQELMTYLKNIFLDMSQIFDALENLEKAGIKFSLSLVGGALRDLFTEKYNLIKELDIVLSINGINDYSYGIDNAQIINWENEYLKNLSIEAQKKYNDWNEWGIDKKIAAIVEIQLSQKIKVKESFIPLNLPKDMKANNVFRSNYHNIFLRGVIKIEDEKLHYTVDILICNSTAENYVSTFDFNICKIMLPISNNDFKKMEINFDWDYLEKIKNNIVVEKDFWIDLVYKKLTLNPVGFDLNALERSLVDHLPRLKNKYEDFKLNLVDYNQNPELDFNVKWYLEKMNEFINLNEKLPTKVDSKKIKPQKI